MERTGSSYRPAKRGTPKVTDPIPDTPLVGIDWRSLTGTGMTPGMQVLYNAARQKRQVR